MILKARMATYIATSRGGESLKAIGPQALNKAATTCNAPAQVTTLCVCVVTRSQDIPCGRMISVRARTATRIALPPSGVARALRANTKDHRLFAPRAQGANTPWQGLKTVVIARLENIQTSMQPRHAQRVLQTPRRSKRGTDIRVGVFATPATWAPMGGHVRHALLANIGRRGTTTVLIARRESIQGHLARQMSQHASCVHLPPRIPPRGAHL